MKSIIKLSPLLAFVLLVGSCQDASDKLKEDRLLVEKTKSTVLMNARFTVTLKENAEDIDSLYYPNVKPIESANGQLSFVFNKPGSKRIEIIGFNKKTKKSKKAFVTVKVVSGITPKKLDYEILKELPHNPENYTQGLEVNQNILYESTGQYGQSKVIAYQYPSLKVKHEKELDKGFFGEGLTVIGDSVYQITWQEQTCFIYNKQLKIIGELSLPTNEGWGIANGGEFLYMTDGTGNLYTVTKALKVKEISPVYFGTKAINSLNELEYVNGKVWANVYGADQIVRINPKTGVIDAYVDFTQLKLRVNNADAEVLNGIAYLPQDDAFLITGKNWDKMFLMRIGE